MRKIAFGLMGIVLVIGLVAACASPAPPPAPAPAPAKPAPTAAAPAPSPTPSPAPAPKPKPGWPASISIASTAPGTGAHSAAVGMADVVTKNMGIKAVPEPGSTGAKNVMLLKDKNVEFAQIIEDQCYDAARGLGDFKQYGKIDVRLVWTSSEPPPFIFITQASTGIKTVNDLKGKKVMMIYPGSMSFTKIADLLLEAVGMTRNDITAMQFSGFAEAMPALKEGRISAFIHPMPSRGLAAFIQAGNLENPLYLFSAPEDKLDAIIAKYPWVVKCALDGKTYGAMTNSKNLITISSPEGMFSRPDVSDDLVYSFMKTVFDRKADVEKFHAQAAIWLAKPLAFKPMVPFHNGAIQYYKEKGLWTAELDAAQKQLLTEVGASK